MRNELQTIFWQKTVLFMLILGLVSFSKGMKSPTEV